MIVIILAIVGALTGWRVATKRGGVRADKLQYAGIYAMMFAVIGLFVTIFVEKML